MKDDNTFGTRTKAMKIDMVTEDIHRLCTQIPSQYVVAKRYMAEARSMLYSDLKRTLKLLEKARNEVRRESVVVTEYNIIRERIHLCQNGSLLGLVDEYDEAISKGKYEAARKIVRKLTAKTISCTPSISVSCTEVSGTRYLEVDSQSPFPVIVALIRVTGSDMDMEVEPASMNLEPFAKRQVMVKGIGDEDEVRVKVDYTEDSVDRTLSTTLSLR